MDMLCIAAAHDPIGYVAVAGRALDSISIARMTGGSESEVASLISELERNGVFSRDRQGRIYSRRMVSDARKAAAARENGKRGGNPSLRKDEGNQEWDNPQVNGGVGDGVKPHKPEAIKERISDASASSVVSGEPKPTTEPVHDEAKIAFDAWNALAKRLSLPVARSLDAGRRTAIRARLADGGLPAWSDALSAIEASSHCRGENDRSWRADLDFVCQKKSWRRLLEGSYGAPKAVAVSTCAEWPDSRWRAALALFAESGLWSDAVGPKPSEPGCRAPAHVLADFSPTKTLERTAA